MIIQTVHCCLYWLCRSRFNVWIMFLRSERMKGPNTKCKKKTTKPQNDANMVWMGEEYQDFVFESTRTRRLVVEQGKQGLQFFHGDTEEDTQRQGTSCVYQAGCVNIISKDEGVTVKYLEETPWQFSSVLTILTSSHALHAKFYHQANTILTSFITRHKAKRATITENAACTLIQYLFLLAWLMEYICFLSQLQEKMTVRSMTDNCVKVYPSASECMSTSQQQPEWGLPVPLSSVILVLSATFVPLPQNQLQHEQQISSAISIHCSLSHVESCLNSLCSLKTLHDIKNKT